MSLLNSTFFWDIDETVAFEIPDPHLGSDDLRERNNLADNAIVQERDGIPVAVRKQSTGRVCRVRYDVLSQSEVESFRFFYEEKTFQVYPKGTVGSSLAYVAMWEGGFFPKMLRAGVYTLEFVVREVI